MSARRRSRFRPAEAPARSAELPGARPAWFASPSWSLPVADRWTAIAIGGLFFLLYVLTRARAWDLPTVYSMDSAELVIASRDLGVDHPPGHPLFLILGYLLSRLPFASPDAGVIMVSVVAGACTAPLLYLAALEMTGRRTAALAGVAAFGLSGIFWLHSTIVEVYAVQSCMLALFAWLAVRAVRLQSPRAVAPASAALGLVASSNVLLAVLLVPAAILCLLGSGLLTSAVADRRRAAWRALAALTLGLAPLLYLPWRLTDGRSYINDLLVVAGYPMQSLRWYAWYLSGWEFIGEKVTAYSIGDYPRLVWQYVSAAWRNLSPAASIVALFGIAVLAGLIVTFARSAAAGVRSERLRIGRRDRMPSRWSLWLRRLGGPDAASAVISAMLLVSFALTAAPVIGYQVPDREVFYLPSFLFASLLATAGTGALAARGHRWQIGAVLLAIAVGAWGMVVGWTFVRPITSDISRYDARLQRFLAIPKDAVIIGYDDGIASRYRYFGMVRGLRPDVRIETFARNAPRYQGALPIQSRSLTDTELRAGLNMLDRVNVMNRLAERYPKQPLLLILTERIPPEFQNFRARRTSFDPQLLNMERKEGVTRGMAPPALSVRVSAEPWPGDVRLIGWSIKGLDNRGSTTFVTPLAMGATPVNAVVLRDELFEFTFAAQRVSPEPLQCFAVFSLLDASGRPVELAEAGFDATRQVQVMDAETPVNGYYRDSFDFRLPPSFPPGQYTVGAKLMVSEGEVMGSYKGREVRRMRPVDSATLWNGQREYVPIGTILVQ